MNPDEAAAVSDVVDEIVPNDNLGAPSDTDFSEVAPDLRPPAGSLAAGMPNLKLETAAGVGGLAPGRLSSQDLHLSSFSAFLSIQTGHSHWLADILNLSPNPWVGKLAAVAAGAGVEALAVGFGVSHATQ